MLFAVDAFLRWAVLVGYLVCAYLYITPLVRGRPPARDLASPLLVLTTGLHAVHLVLTCLEYRRMVFLQTVLQATTLYAIVLAASTLIVQARSRNKAFSGFAVWFAALLYLVSLLNRQPHAGIKPELDSNLFEIHAVSAFIGYGAFFVACVAGVMYLVLAEEIRRRRLGRLFSGMPSLETLDQLGYRAILVGIAFFSAGIVSGWVWALRLPDQYRGPDPKEVMSLVTWGLFAANAAARWWGGWRGRRTALLSILGFAVSLVTLFGTGGGASGRHEL